MHVFWRFGYKATSVEQLTGSMGINRFSLYETFGDKRALYLKALAKYRQKIATELLAGFDDQRGLVAIQSYFERLADILSTELGRNGCLMQNATVESALEDAGIAAETHAFNDHLQGLFHRALSQARATGCLSDEEDLHDRARALFALAQGMMVLAKDAPASDTQAVHGTARFVVGELQKLRRRER